MLKGFYIWNRLTPFLKKLILLICFILEIPLSISYFHKIYVSYLDANLWMSEMWLLLIFVLFVLYFASILFRMAGKEMEDFSLIGYWTSLSDCGCYAYIICRLIPWIELGLFFSLMFGVYDYIHPVIILPVVLSIDFFVIFLGMCHAKAKSVRGKSLKVFTERKHYIIKSPFLQLIWITLWQRLRCIDVTLITVLTDAIFIALCKIVKGEIQFVVSIIFMVFLFILQDRFFENEGKSFIYYKSIGIPLKKYLLAQVCSSIIYSETVVVIFFVMNSRNILRIIFFVLLLLGFSIYWNISFIYSESNHQQERFAKFWYEIICLWISLVPIINVIWVCKIYHKIEKGWNHD